MGGCIAVAVFWLVTMRLYQESTDNPRYTMRKSKGVYTPPRGRWLGWEGREWERLLVSKRSFQGIVFV